MSDLKKNKNINYKGLSAKLVATFVILIIIPIIVIGYISVNTSSKSLIEKAKQSLLNSTVQTANYYEAMLRQIEKGYVMQVKFGNGVKEFFQTKEYNNPEDGFKIKDAVNGSITSLVSAFPDVFSSVFLIKDNGEVLGYPPDQLTKEMKLNTTDWYINAMKNGKNLWVEEHNEGVPKVYDTDYILSYLLPFSISEENKVGGLLVLDIKSKAFENLLSSVHAGNNSISYIITPSYRIINQNGELDTNINVDENDVLRDAVNYAKSKNNFVFIQKMNGINYIASFSKSETTGWIFVTAIPESEITSATRGIQYQVALLGIICAILAVLIGIRVSFTITTPVKKLMGVMGRAAQGDLGANIILNRKDEIGALVSSFNSMLEQIRYLVSQSKNLSDKVSLSSENIAKISSKTNNITSEVSATIQEIANGTSNQVSEVEKSLVAVSKLADEIGEVVKSVESMRSVSEDVRKITNMGIKTADGLNRKASETNKITSNVVENIGQLNTLVQNIDRITKLLESMSEQTKLLSLNASIESARAGEAGRGFSVVAEEIRKLAEQSNASSREIDNLVQKILAQTQASTELVLNAQKVINQQYVAVEDTSSMFAKINDATNVLNESMEKISTEVSTMDTHKTQVVLSIQTSSAVSEETASATEEVFAATEEQLAVTEQLTEMTKQLKELSQSLNFELNKFIL